MKKALSRIILMLALVIKAATIVVPNYSTPLLLTAAVPLVLLGVILFIGRNGTLSAQLPWIAVVGTWIFFMLPMGPVSVDGILYVIGNQLDGISSMFEDEMVAICLLALIALQVFFRRKSNFLFVLARYVTALVVLSALRDTMYPYADTYRVLVPLIVVLCLTRELIGSTMETSIPSMLRCILTVLFFLIIGGAYSGDYIADKIDAFFLMDSANWLKTVLVVLCVGILVLVDDYQRCGSDQESIFAVRNVGWVMLIWCLFALIMVVFDDFRNLGMLFYGFPLCSVIAHSMISNLTSGKQNWALVFSMNWTFLGLMLLMITKTINRGVILSYLLILLLLVLGFNWRKLVVDEVNAMLLLQIGGIVAIVMMATMRLTDIMILRDIPGIVLSLVLCCVIWCLICGHITKLDKDHSKLATNEFDSLIGVWGCVVFLLLLVAVIKVLFVL